MATKIKTTVTFTFSFTSTDEKTAIHNLLYWMDEYHVDTKPTVRRDCESGEYTITDDWRVSNSFKFSNVAELAQKYGTYFSAYELARAMLDYCKNESVTATSETIEVEDN
jgi:hypothetical protein